MPVSMRWGLRKSLLCLNLDEQEDQTREVKRKKREVGNIAGEGMLIPDEYC